MTEDILPMSRKGCMLRGMHTRPFGRLGPCSPLGIGNLQPDPAGGDWAEVAAIYERLLDAGCTLIDSAQCYGASEAFLGERLRHRRDRFLLVSKCGHHEVLADGSWRSRTVSMADIDGALTRLRTDHLDAMLLHSYDLEPLQRGEALEVLRAARQAGKIRAIGYSGDNERAAWAIDHGGIDVVEMSLSLADQANAGLAERAAAKGIAVIAKRPLANAAWRYTDPASAPDAHRLYATRLAALGLDPARHGCADMGELALRFTISLPGNPVAIVASRGRANQDANLAAAAKGPLPAATMALIRARFAEAARHGGDWAGCN
ncbi:MAG: hypothetical protein RLZZ127_2500 [Planctomycetota bacterium]